MKILKLLFIAFFSAGLLSCTKLAEIGDTFRTDIIAPSVTGFISLSGVTGSSLTASWGAAFDDKDPQASLQYKLVKDDSAAANISSIALADAKTGADVLMDWTTNTTSKAVTSGIFGLRTYYFTVLVRDTAGNKATYTTVSQTMPSGPFSQFNGIATDSAGNFYAAGNQGQGSVDYGSGVAATGDYNGNNAFVVKYDSTGKALWAKGVTGGGNPSSFAAVAIDASGNVFAAGSQNGAGTFDYGGQTATGIFSSAGNVVIVKYSAAGVIQWAKSVSAGVNQSAFYGVAIDTSGNAYAVGYQNGTAVFDYGGQTTTGTSTGQNPLIVKYNGSGVAQWAKSTTAGGAGTNCVFQAVAVDTSGNAFVVGCQEGTPTYDYGGQTATAVAGGKNALIVKYDTNGTTQWARVPSTAPSTSWFYGAAVDSGGNVYATGNQNNNGSFTYAGQSVTGAVSGNTNAVIVKYDTTGTGQWARSTAAGSNSSQFNGVTVDSGGNIFAAGFQYGSGTFTYGVQSATGIIGSFQNNVIVKYNSAGTAQYAYSTAAGACSKASFNAVAVLSGSNVYAAGYEQYGTGYCSYTSGVITKNPAQSTNANGNALIVRYTP